MCTAFCLCHFLPLVSFVATSRSTQPRIVGPALVGMSPFCPCLPSFSRTPPPAFAHMEWTTYKALVGVDHTSVLSICLNGPIAEGGFTLNYNTLSSSREIFAPERAVACCVNAPRPALACREDVPASTRPSHGGFCAPGASGTRVRPNS